MSKLAIVTGGIRGIGAAISTALHNHGYDVIANYLSHKDIADKFSDETGIPTMSWNVGNVTECHEAITKIEIETGKSVSILINNAGIVKDSMLHRMTPQQWNDVVNVNLSSCFNMASSVIKKCVNKITAESSI